MTSSANTNHWKLGLFVVASFALMLTVFAFIGARSMKREGVRYVSYFDESVQGLEVGSPVKYRGVTIGAVAEISVAPDRRHVEVRSELTVDVLEALGLRVSPKGHATMHVPDDLRVQLATTGLTGVKFVLIDFFETDVYPAPQLPFPVPENYIPAAPSVMKNLEDSLTRTAHKVPELADDLGLILQKVNRMMDEIEDKQLGTRAAMTLENTNQLLTEARGKLRDVDAAKLSKQASTALEGLNGTVERMNKMIDRVDGDKGLLVNMERASVLVGDVARDANGIESEMEKTMRDVQEAAKSIRKLADALERDPDMLLKGRARNTQ
jgi:phospholipid/cholesterol/gamma-HCH transport system substrate-binding protein